MPTIKNKLSFFYMIISFFNKTYLRIKIYILID